MENIENQQQQEDIKDNMFGQMQIDEYGWAPQPVDYKVLLENLKSQDEMVIYESILTLSNQLCVAQENTLKNFTLDQYLPVLISILKRPTFSDISNEINLYCVNCLTNLMDIYPTISSKVVTLGAVKCVYDVMEKSMGFIDLTEACIKNLEKVSLDNPYSILQSGVLSLSLNMMDFFEYNTQKRILQLVLNSCSHIATVEDFDHFIQPIVPTLCSLINTKTIGNQEKIEIISSIFVRINDSFVRFLSPNSQFQAICLQFVKLADLNIIECLIQILYEYSINNQITDKKDQKYQKTITQQTIKNILKAFSISSRFSFTITKQLIELDIIKIIEGFLPSEKEQKQFNFSQENYPFIIDSITLLDNIFPDREESLVSEFEKLRLNIERDKKAYIINSDQTKILFVAEKILPKIFNVYENNMQMQLRTKLLQIIDKILEMFNNDMINNFIEPYSFAKFIYSNIKQLNSTSIKICLQMIQKLMQINPKLYTMPFIREGIIELIQEVSTEQGFETFMKTKFNIDLPQEKDQEKQKQEYDAFIKAKKDYIQQQINETEDEEQKIQFQLHLQKYLEQQQLKHQQLTQPIINQNEQNKQILSLAQNLNQQYFKNDKFLDDIKQQCKDEYELMESMRILSLKLQEESMNVNYNETQLKQILKQLIEYLVSSRQIMTYEFKESGLLQSLNMFLSLTPNRVKYQVQKQNQKEEIKHSEQIKLEQLYKDSQTITKKEARTYLQRLKLFTHFILQKQNNNIGINKLIHLCHDILSYSETKIFQIKDQSLLAQNYSSFSFLSQNTFTDLSAQVNALKQLSKRIKIHLIYDPLQKGLNSEKKEEPLLQKLKSSNSDLIDYNKSKIFQKRDQLYNELGQVMVSVEQCASLGLIQDFLRNSIKNMNDVKSFKIPNSYYDKTKKVLQKNTQVQQILEKCKLYLRDLIEYGSITGDELINQISQEFEDRQEELSLEEQIDVVRLIEEHSVQMMDKIYLEYDETEKYQLEQMKNDLFEEKQQIHNQNNEELAEIEQRLLDFNKQIQIFKIELCEKEQKDLKKEVSKEEKNLEQQIQQKINQKQAINEELEDLLNQKGAQDIDYQFFYNGQQFDINQTIFEIQKLNTQKKHSYYQEIFYMHFSIKDQQPLIQNKKESFFEISKKDKSDESNNIYLSSVNMIVQHLVDKEFQVFQQGEDQSKEQTQLEQCLQILKILNFLCRNCNFISSQCMKYFLNKNDEDEEMKETGFTDFDLQMNLKQIHPSIFHHHKLDSYIIKNIQDPYNIIGKGITTNLQQILKNCSFLFPFQTRQLFFKLMAFVSSIDMNRCIYFLKQYLKQKGCYIQPTESQSQEQKQLKQKIVVNRQNIMENAFGLIQSLNKRQFLEIEFEGEIGTGLGPTLEFYSLLSDEIKNYQINQKRIWRPDMPDNGLFPAPFQHNQDNQDEQKKVYEVFKLMGTLVGKSLSDDKLIDLPFSNLFWDLVLGKKVNILDLERIDRQQFKIFSELLVIANKKKTIEKANIEQDAKQRQIKQLKTHSDASVEDLCLYFVYPGYDYIELIQNGSQIQVTMDNLQEYIDQIMDFTFNELIKLQIEGFKKGLSQLFQIDQLKAFQTQDFEIEELICGQDTQSNEWSNFNYLQQNIIPAHGYHQKSQQYLYFIQMIMEIKHEDRRKLIKFLTGSQRLPHGGFSTLDPKLTIVFKKPIQKEINPDSILPSVMTCQNYVKVPGYSSYNIMKERFERAYNDGANNFNLS